MRKLLLILLLFISCSTSTIQSVYNHVQLDYLNGSTQLNILHSINDFREDNNITRLLPDSLATQVALRRSIEIMKEFEKSGSISHNGAGFVFELLSDRGAEGFGEILAKSFLTVDGLMKGWIGSDSHRSQILKVSYEYIGVGVHKNEDSGDIFYCVIFVVDYDN